MTNALVFLDTRQKPSPNQNSLVTLSASIHSPVAFGLSPRYYFTNQLTIDLVCASSSGLVFPLFEDSFFAKALQPACVHHGTSILQALHKWR